MLQRIRPAQDGEPLAGRTGADRVLNVFVVVCVLAVLALVMLGWSLFTSSRKADASASLVRHTHEVVAATMGFREQLAIASSNQRGYLLSADDTYLRRRNDAL